MRSPALGCMGLPGLHGVARRAHLFGHQSSTSSTTRTASHEMTVFAPLMLTIIPNGKRPARIPDV